ncbi:AfsR/SARP family transcriptional regulator [Actinocrispum wychmicini]|uniref:DNA-binding SARP family transcriptional activator n=1 Tax=Actinocrispum wychmicini TaxID=1213861 RepID=A0A4R2JRR0_9PSEU|nr:BTAD domain-containing putative transcriptional regulator [Actinocrispum wychmicini]TCO59549.1 DNA-binding SARP family transcriptional activator [Actinocrispum wychmicini]
MTVEFRVLGPVEAWVDGRQVELGHARQRWVLAVLLIEANQWLSADQLLDRAWGERIPGGGRATLYGYLSRLRRALHTADEVRIARRVGGYELVVDEDTVDLHRLRRLLANARAGDDDRAPAFFQEAFGLWRGDVCTGLDTPWINTVRADLDQQRLAAELDHVDLRLRVGQHTGLLSDLTALAVAHPLDERVAGQLMLALYRSGRQAEALQHYDQARRRLAEELGTDPSPVLQRLHQLILTADSTVTVPTNPPKSARSPMPRQLPASPRFFTGRAGELAALTDAMAARVDAGGTVVISAIGGTGGIGKTWLALHWAHVNVHRFPDGQFFVNLRGFDPTSHPLDPAVALRGFLNALGVEPAAIPQELDAQTALYRSLIADKRMLVLLDNALDTAQVTPLLPGSPTVTVVITSRNTLPALITSHGARPLALDVLTDDEARQLLSTHLGADRVAAEPHAVADLLQHCAGFPLALGIIAARATTDPALPLATLAAEIRDSATRLDALDTGELPASLRAVFSWSYHALPPDAARAFGLLGLAPGPDISLPAAANLTARPTQRIRPLMRELETAHLIDQPVPGRYRMHDLLRLYATEQANTDQSDDVRDTALRRLVDFYLRTALAGDRLLAPHRPAIHLKQPPDCHRQPFPDHTAAFTWFDTEHLNLQATHHLATTLGWHQAVGHLSWALTTFRELRGHLHDNVAAWRAGLAAADNLADPAARHLAHQQLGHACARAGRHEEALHHLGRALALAEDIGDRPGQAHTYGLLGWAWEQRGEDRRALEHATQALNLYQTLDNPVWKAHSLSQVGWLQARLGDYDLARVSVEAALAGVRSHRNRHGEARNLDSLGLIAYQTGQYILALDYYQQALTLHRDLGNSCEEADILDRLGHPHSALGHYEQARAAWHQAVGLYQAQHRTEDAARVQHELDALRGRTP